MKKPHEYRYCTVFAIFSDFPVFRPVVVGEDLVMGGEIDGDLIPKEIGLQRAIIRLLQNTLSMVNNAIYTKDKKEETKMENRTDRELDPIEEEAAQQANDADEEAQAEQEKKDGAQNEVAPLANPCSDEPAPDADPQGETNQPVDPEKPE